MGLESCAQGGVESEPGDSSAKNSDIGEESWRCAMACSLVGDLVIVSTAQQEPDTVPEMPAVHICSAKSIWKEPAHKRDVPSGETVGEGSDKAIDRGVRPDCRQNSGPWMMSYRIGCHTVAQRKNGSGDTLRRRRKSSPRC